MKLDRIMIAAPASGSGKTSVTAGLLNLLKRHGKNPASFKCGPDYIDPMFHRSVLGTPCRNLDTFFTGEKITRYLLEEGAKESGIAVLEGVMGYFDGLGFESSKAGSSDLAGMTDTPVILVIPARGMSRSILALIKGFLDFDPKKCIRGIILNRLNPMLYDRMKTMIENELPIKVVGYVPEMKDFVLQSRHLGLLSPDEIGSLKEGIESLTDIMEKTIDLEVLLSIAADAPELPYERDHAAYREAFTDALAKADYRPDPSEPVRIAVAKDAAFSFLYADNLELLREMGAEITFFSPLADDKLPERTEGILFPGGYPELYAKELSQNRSMIESIRSSAGIPFLAECGGFMYLQESLTTIDGNTYPMAGVLPGHTVYTGRLKRFGYITLTEGRVFGEDVGDIRAHEFHYYDSDETGEAFLAVKPTGNRSWRCCAAGRTFMAGFPHLYYPANMNVPAVFLKRCMENRTSDSI